MQYDKTVILRDGRTCLIRSASAEDAESVLASFRKTHEESSFLLSYPEEISFTLEDEALYLRKKAESGREAELVAIVDGHICGSAGIDAIGNSQKIRHRAEFGISIEAGFQDLGIGSAMVDASIECARRAGYRVLELEVVDSNSKALSLYRRKGFREYGIHPMGFALKDGSMQKLVMMYIEL
ncbi:MAG: GNAT family N-acetyltransferase [Candidatus Ornithospirochaeta sp.]|nr:GNAT family N-acetyltransferase [Candidatus Ornithospirochaeta sp.]